MKRDLIAVYRKSSPRTGRDYDVKMIEKRQLAAYLKRGYLADKPKKKPKPKPDHPEPEPERPKIRGVKTIPPSELSDETKAAIKKAKGTQKTIAERFGVTPYTVGRIKSGKIK